MADFNIEKARAERLMQRLGVVVSDYQNPNTKTYESGADVLAIVDGTRIGIQVTDLDTGPQRGQMRAEEKRLSTGGGAYAMWAQNDPAKMCAAVAEAVARKVAIANRHTFAEFDEVWLLVSALVPDAPVSTAILPDWLTADALTQATGAKLTASKYKRAYLHPGLHSERALYQWSAEAGWTLHTIPLDPSERTPWITDILGDEKWTSDPHGMANKIIKEILGER